MNGKNKTAKRIHVRIPDWVSKQEVRCQVDGSGATEWLNNYLLFEEVNPFSRVVIEFPVREQTIQRTEGGTGTVYTIHFRGNTGVEISPRGSEAASSVSACTLRKVNQAGALGLFSSLLNDHTALGGEKFIYRLDEFRNFRAMDSNGHVLFEDGFEASDGRLSGWRDP
jgi:hypothetical protein